MCSTMMARIMTALHLQVGQVRVHACGCSQQSGQRGAFQMYSMRVPQPPGRANPKIEPHLCSALMMMRAWGELSMRFSFLRSG